MIIYSQLYYFVELEYVWWFGFDILYFSMYFRIPGSDKYLSKVGFMSFCWLFKVYNFVSISFSLVVILAYVDTYIDLSFLLT